MRIESPFKTVLGIFLGVNSMAYDFNTCLEDVGNRLGCVGAPVDGLGHFLLSRIKKDVCKQCLIWLLRSRWRRRVVQWETIMWRDGETSETGLCGREKRNFARQYCWPCYGWCVHCEDEKL